MVILDNKIERSVMKYKKDVQKEVHDKYRPIIDLVYKLYCVPSQADDTMKEIKVLLKEAGHVDTINLKEVK